jgi:hypothetical protein
LVLIGLKVTYLTVMMVLTIIAYQKKKRGVLNVQIALCVFYILEVRRFESNKMFKMVALMIFDFTGKYIIMLYFMLVFSSYATYALYYWVLAKNPMAACSQDKL